MHETFWTLLRDKAHWEFEIFLMVVFDLFLAGAWRLFVRQAAKRRARIEEWGATWRPIPKLETPAGICEQCGGIVKHLIESGIKWCLGCGDIRVVENHKPEEPL